MSTTQQWLWNNNLYSEINDDRFDHVVSNPSLPWGYPSLVATKYVEPMEGVHWGGIPTLINVVGPHKPPLVPPVIHPPVVNPPVYEPPVVHPPIVIQPDPTTPQPDPVSPVPEPTTWALLMIALVFMVLMRRRVRA